MAVLLEKALHQRDEATMVNEDKKEGPVRYVYAMPCIGGIAIC